MKLEDQKILSEIAANEKDGIIRDHAKHRLDELRRMKKSEEEKKNNKEEGKL